MESLQEVSLAMMDNLGFSCCAVVPPPIDEVGSSPRLRHRKSTIEDVKPSPSQKPKSRHRKRKSDCEISPTENDDWTNQMVRDYVEQEKKYINSPSTRHRKRRSADFFIPPKQESTNSKPQASTAVDTNPRWAGCISEGGFDRARLTPSKTFDSKILFSCPSEESNASFKGLLFDNPSLFSKTAAPPMSPNTKEFIRKQSNSQSIVQEVQSPCGVDDLDDMYGWHRSLAWSESDDSLVEEASFDDHENLIDHLSIPANIGKEFAPEDHPLNGNHGNLTSTLHAFRSSLSKTTGMADNIRIKQTKLRDPSKERILGPHDLETLELLADLAI